MDLAFVGLLGFSEIDVCGRFRYQAFIDERLDGSRHVEEYNHQCCLIADLFLSTSTEQPHHSVILVQSAAATVLFV